MYLKHILSFCVLSVLHIYVLLLLSVKIAAIIAIEQEKNFDNKCFGVTVTAHQILTQLAEGCSRIKCHQGVEDDFKLNSLRWWFNFVFCSLVVPCDLNF